MEILAGIGVTVAFLAATVLLGRKLTVVRRLALSFVVAAGLAGLLSYRALTQTPKPWTTDAVEFLLILLIAVTLIGIAGLYFFQIYVYSRKRLRLPQMLPPFALFAAYVTAILIIVKASFPDQDLSFILSAGAVTSLVIGLALQPLLTNLFAGVVISLEQPFRINDWIRIGEEDGQVVQINWRTTHLRNRDNDHLVIPNARIADQELVNYHYPHPLHMERIYVGTHYRHPPYRVRQALIAATKRVDAVLEKPSPEVFLKSFDDSSISYELRLWVGDLAALPRIASEVRGNIWEEFKKSNITIPFPIRTLEIEPAARRLDIGRAPPEVSGQGPSPASLFVVKGHDVGRSVALTGQAITVGRSGSCDLVIRDPSASGEHFEISWSGEEYLIKDLGSQHGSHLNGVKIKTEAPIKNWDRIRIGDTEIAFESYG